MHERRRVRGIEEIASIHLPRREHAHRRLVLLQRADLHRRRMRAQQRVLSEVQRVMQLHRRMIGREVERSEVIPLRFGFRTEGDGKSELTEDLADFVDHERDRVQRASPHATRRHRRIERRGAGDRRLSCHEHVERLVNVLLERIERSAGGTPILGRQFAKRALQRGQSVVLSRVELPLGDIEARVGFEPVKQCARILREGISLGEILGKLHGTKSEIGGSRWMAERVRCGCTKGRHRVDAGPTT